MLGNSRCDESECQKIPAINQPHRLSAPDIVRKHQHFGIALDRVMRIELVFQRAEPARERNLCRGRDILIAYRNHFMRVKGTADFFKAFRAQAIEIDRCDFCTHGGADPANLHVQLRSGFRLI